MNVHIVFLPVLTLPNNIEQGSPKDGYIPPFFSQPDWYVEPDQNCTLPLVKNGKIGNTSCLISCDIDIWGMDPGHGQCTSSK